jgi:hypothetical protein
MLCDCGWAIVVCKKRGEDECEIVTMTKEGGEGGVVFGTGLPRSISRRLSTLRIATPASRFNLHAAAALHARSGNISCTQRCSIENWQLLRAQNLLIPQEAGGKAA